MAEVQNHVPSFTTFQISYHKKGVLKTPTTLTLKMFILSHINECASKPRYLLNQPRETDISPSDT